MTLLRRISSAFSSLRQRCTPCTTLFSRGWVRVLSYLVLAILLATAACATYSYTQRRPWRAVFLSNGQVYFGKFVPPLFWHFGTLTNIYYLQVNSKPLQPVAKTEAAVVTPGAQPNAQGVPPSAIQEQKPVAQSPAQSKADTTRSSVLVVKLGDELHGPEDIMTIPASSILFWEDLRSDSEVVLTINRARNVTSKK